VIPVPSVSEPLAPGLRIPEVVPIPSGRLPIRDGERRTPRALAIESFFLGRTPVTNLEYAACVESGTVPAPPWSRHPDFTRPRQPVVGVTWDEASAYCAWLGERAGGRWRLPREAEWEFAMCGGLESPATAWGGRVPGGEVPEGTLTGPWDTGLGTPNGYGVLDPGTVVHEWCAEWRDWRDGRELESAPRGPRRRASRGGSWRHRVRWSSPSARSSLPPDYRYSDYGFRVLRERDLDG